MQHNENELLKQLVLSSDKTPVRVPDFLLEIIDKSQVSRQEFVALAIIEKLATKTKGFEGVAKE